MVSEMPRESPTYIRVLDTWRTSKSPVPPEAFTTPMSHSAGEGTVLRLMRTASRQPAGRPDEARIPAKPVSGAEVALCMRQS